MEWDVAATQQRGVTELHELGLRCGGLRLQRGNVVPLS